ncbi:suppressor of Cytokine Signaling at 44A [Haematobia irritans]|uniref:suppressor of Cytokine Signaling at 44A n=1 Tax=Haematobia irritans TaxID=7368 RepID=UPI003F4F9386
MSSEREKKGWFHSLTRRKKSQSQNSINLSAAISDNELLPTPAATSSQIQSNNNNTIDAEATCHTVVGRKRKEEKNAFQRFRKKMGLRFSLRRRKSFQGDGGATTDASSEFLTSSPVHQPLQFNFKGSNTTNDEADTFTPFSNDFKRFIKKKWLEREDGPNWIMYGASSEMLNQVWYWGEISRRDAQKQLTDKPTGSFLVRDSETSGCQFTLSFRIVNVTLHYRLEYRNDYWHFEELEYESIVEMIEDILYRCTNDNFVCFVKVPNEVQPPFPVILKYPLSRYWNMPKLQDLCRRVIQRTTKSEDISKLSIPPRLQIYLAEKRELVF